MVRRRRGAAAAAPGPVRETTAFRKAEKRYQRRRSGAPTDFGDVVDCRPGAPNTAANAARLSARSAEAARNCSLMSGLDVWCAVNSASDVAPNAREKHKRRSFT